MSGDAITSRDVQTDKCQRWRKIAIDQLSYALNLTLTFSVAALGYCFALLKDGNFTLEHPAKCSMILSMSALTASILVGFSCTVVRLENFKGTARRACNHPNKPTKEAMRDLDSVVWNLFYAQLIAFVVGAISLGITLLLNYGSKLV